MARVAHHIKTLWKPARHVWIHVWERILYGFILGEYLKDTEMTDPNAIGLGSGGPRRLRFQRVERMEFSMIGVSPL